MSKRVAEEDKQDETENCKKARNDEKNWNDMPMEVKIMIMNNMDYITRNRLKMCSKSDKCLVEAFPMVIPYISSTNRRGSHHPTHFFVRDPHSNSVGLKVEHNPKMVKVYKYGKLRRYYRNKERNDTFKIVEEFFYGILLAKNLRIEYFRTEWNLNESCIPYGHMFHFDTVEISILNGEECIKWLNHIAPGVEKISTEWGSHIEGVGDIPCVLNAKNLRFSDTDINDEQLLNFKATQLVFMSRKVTVEGIRNLIKKWIDEDYPMDSTFSIRISYIPRHDLCEVRVFEGFEYKLENQNHATVALGPNKVISVQQKNNQGGFHVSATISSKN